MTPKMSALALAVCLPVAALAQNPWAPENAETAQPVPHVWANTPQPQSVYAPADLDQQLTGRFPATPAAPTYPIAPQPPYGYGVGNQPYGGFNGFPTMQPNGFGTSAYPSFMPNFGSNYSPFGGVPTGGSPFFDRGGFGMW